MEREEVVSSFMESIGYDKENLILEIKFKSGIVTQYIGVPEGIYANLMKAASYGSYFERNIENIYIGKDL
ncbi:MAG: KTSC domain-containing protein [Candidatus Gracilibacteria bacterium]|nr:KTSC domain-containing protein [Candidatus Gracilibacteria bacterium]MDD4530739.1 KTSC domain-containing protein [Candidatus Gracilibacteria bacterium]